MSANTQRLLQKFSTVVTCLCRETGVHSHHTVTSAFSLVTENVEKLAPTGVHDTFSKVMIFHHIGDLKVFDGNMVIVVSILLSCLEMEVSSLTANLEMRLGDVLGGFASAMRTLLPSAQRTLLAPQGGLTLAIVARISNSLPLRVRQEGFESHINADIRI